MVEDSGGLGADRVDVRRGPATTGDRQGQDAQFWSLLPSQDKRLTAGVEGRVWAQNLSVNPRRVMHSNEKS